MLPNRLMVLLFECFGKNIKDCCKHLTFEKEGCLVEYHSSNTRAKMNMKPEQNQCIHELDNLLRFEVLKDFYQ